MKEGSIEVVEMEHPEYCTASVFSRWRVCPSGNFRLVPFAVEFSLFTPLHEQQVLTEALAIDRVDIPLSVSE